MLSLPPQEHHLDANRLILDGPAVACRLLVRHLEAYCVLSNGDKAALLGTNAEVRQIEAGEDLVYEEAPPQGVFVIVKGFACRYKLSQHGSRHIAAYLLPDDFCDLDALLLPRMDHSISALSDCTAALLAPKTVHDLLQRPQLARALRLATLIETANMLELLVNVGMRRAAERVAHLIELRFSRLTILYLPRLRAFAQYRLSYPHVDERAPA